MISQSGDPLPFEEDHSTDDSWDFDDDDQDWYNDSVDIPIEVYGQAGPSWVNVIVSERE